MRRHVVASPSIRRHFGTKCPLGIHPLGLYTLSSMTVGLSKTTINRLPSDEWVNFQKKQLCHFLSFFFFFRFFFFFLVFFLNSCQLSVKKRICSRSKIFSLRIDPFWKGCFVFSSKQEVQNLFEQKKKH